MERLRTIARMPELLVKATKLYLRTTFTLCLAMYLPNTSGSQLCAYIRQAPLRSSVNVRRLMSGPVTCLQSLKHSSAVRCNRKPCSMHRSVIGWSEMR